VVSDSGHVLRALQSFDPSGEVDASAPLRPLLAAIDRALTASEWGTRSGAKSSYRTGKVHRVVAGDAAFAEIRFER
jgi:hypothetical protein